jgi:hypothetical protein
LPIYFSKEKENGKTGTVKKNWIWAKVGANNYSPLQRFPGGDRREGDSQKKILFFNTPKRFSITQK